MKEKEILLNNLEKVHTTKMGEERIKRNLLLNTDDAARWCKNKMRKEDSLVYKRGKNYYVEVDQCKICINSSSYTIITAHLIK